MTGDVLGGKLLEIENAIVYHVFPELEADYQSSDHKGPAMVEKMNEEMNHILDHLHVLADRFRGFYAMSLGDLDQVESVYSTLDMESDTPLDPDRTDYGTTVRATINLGLTRQINPAAYQLDEYWSGDAASGFKAFLLGSEQRYGTEGGLQNAAKEHMAFATILATYVHLYSLSVLEVLHKLEAIADATIAALLHPEDDDGSFSISVMLDLLGFVPGPVGIVAGLASFAKDIGQYAYQKSHQPDYETPTSKRLSIRGDREHPSRALDSARELVTWLERSLADEDQKFRDRINEFLTGVRGFMHSATGRSLMVEAPRAGDRVTLATPHSHIGAAVEPNVLNVVRRRLAEKGVAVRPDVKLGAWDGGKGIFINSWLATEEGGYRVEPELIEFECDTLIVDLGFEPDGFGNDKELAEIAPVRRIGDCMVPRNLQAAMWDAAGVVDMV